MQGNLYENVYFETSVNCFNCFPQDKFFVVSFANKQFSRIVLYTRAKGNHIYIEKLCDQHGLVFPK